MHPYPKKILSVSEQLSAMKQGELVVESDEFAYNVLSTIGYYRLRGYLFPYYNSQTKKYVAGTKLETIVQLYKFNAQLSLLLTGMTSKIEVALRVHTTEALLSTGDALAYLDPVYFCEKEYFWKNIASMSGEISRSSDVFIEHNFTHHNGQIPIWALVEVISFGSLSKLVKTIGTATPEAKKIYQAISSCYKYMSDKSGTVLFPKPEMLSSWIHTVTIIRNICAHNGRIYNRTLSVKPQIIKHDLLPKQPGKYGLFESMLAMKYIRSSDEDWVDFISSFTTLIDQFEDQIELHRLGFPVNWKDYFLL